MSGKKRSARGVAGFAWIAALLLPALALGQVVTNPNQIKGTFELTSPNPEILALLEGEEGLYRYWIGGTSVDVSPPLTGGASGSASR